MAVAEYLTEITKLEEIARRLEPNDLLKEENLKSLRNQSFRIESMARTLRHVDSKDYKSFFDGVLVETKMFEDLLGQYSLIGELEQFARRNNLLTAQITSALARERVSAQETLLDFLEEKKWVGQEPQKFEELKSVPVKEISDKKMYKTLRSLTASELKDLSTDYKSKFRESLSTHSYDYEIFENQLHSFRRKLRWFGLILQSFPTFFKLTELPDKLNSDETRLIEKWGLSPYTQLGREESAIEIDRIAFYWLSEYIEKLGVLKDHAEGNYYLYFLERGETLSNRENYVLPDDWKLGIEIEVHALLFDWEQLKVLKRLRKRIKDSK